MILQLKKDVVQLLGTMAAVIEEVCEGCEKEFGQDQEACLFCLNNIKDRE